MELYNVLLIASAIAAINCKIPILSFGKRHIHKCLVYYQFIRVQDIQKHTLLSSKIIMHTAITSYQKRFNLKQTGVADETTVTSMLSKGCQSTYTSDRNDKKKLITTNTNQYHHENTRRLWYSDNTFIMWDDELPKYAMKVSDSLYAAEQAFNMFSALKRLYLRYEYVTPKWRIDVRLGFMTRKHVNCQKGFDGPGGITSHSEDVPNRIHFDDHDVWAIQRDKINNRYRRPGYYRNGQDYIQTLLFYAGRIFEMKPNNIKGSVMDSIRFMVRRTDEYNIPDRDIKELDGRGHLDCWAPKVTSAFSNYLYNGRTYLMVGRYTYMIDDQTKHVKQTWPRMTNEAFSKLKLPEIVDEAFTYYAERLLYFFKGSKYYAVNKQNTMFTVHHKLSAGWPGLPDRIDAAFVHIDWKTYFFRDDKVYLWNPKLSGAPGPYPKSGRVEPGWPKNITDVFPNAPTHIDTAFRFYYDNRLYFFKGPLFWVWDKKQNSAVGPYKINDVFKPLCEIYRCANRHGCSGWFNEI